MNSNHNDGRKQAVALSYLPDSNNAPKVVAKGKGKVAETIVAKAKDNLVPVKEDPALVNLLSELQLNDNIPEELYQAVAEIFSFLYKTDQIAARK